MTANREHLAGLDLAHKTIAPYSSWCGEQLRLLVEQAKAAQADHIPDPTEMVTKQVLEVVPESFLIAARQADDVLTVIIRNNEPLATLERTYGKDWCKSVGTIRKQLILQIVAAQALDSAGGAE